MPAVDPGLAAIFEGLSQFGERTPGLVGDWQRHTLLQSEEDRKKKAEGKKDEFNLTLGQLFDQYARDDAGPAGPQQMGVGPTAPVPFAAAGVDPTVAMALAPMPQQDPFKGFPNPAGNPSALDLQNAARFQLPKVEQNPRQLILETRMDGVRRLMAKYPDQIETVSPILNDLERQHAAVVAGDKDLADAWEHSLQRRYQSLATGFQEGQANARNNADNANKKVEVPDPAKIQNMTPAQLLSTIETYKGLIASDNANGDGKLAQNLSPKLADVLAEYNRRGGIAPVKNDNTPAPPATDFGKVDSSAWGSRVLSQNGVTPAATPSLHAAAEAPKVPTAASSDAEISAYLSANGRSPSAENIVAVRKKLKGK